MAVQKSQETVLAYFPMPGDRREFLARVSAAIRANTSLSHVRLDSPSSWAVVGAEDWEGLWTRDVRPIVVSDRITVRPLREPQAFGPPDASPRPSSDIDVVLLPGPAFGTPGHPTTLTCLRCLDRLVRPGDSLLDAGTGSGVLAIAAVLLGAEHVLALDSDPHATETARRNVRANGVAGQVEVRTLELAPETELSGRGFDGVIANLEPSVLGPLVPRLTRLRAPGGWMLLSGSPVSDRQEVLDALGQRAPARNVEEFVLDGWWSAVHRGG